MTSGTRRIAELAAKHQANHGLQRRPCTDDEIRVLEERLGKRLPAAYRYILLCDGHGGLELLAGTDWSYQYVLEIQGSARAMAGRDGFSFDDSYLVLAMHQGYQFFFVDVTRGDDPPLMHYIETSARASQISATMTAGIAELIELELASSWRRFSSDR